MVCASDSEATKVSELLLFNMFSSLKWAGAAANDNSLTNSNVSFDPSLPCASGDEDARDAIIYADEPKKLVKRLSEKPQEIHVDSMYESAKGIFRLYESDIVEHVIRQEVKDKRVQILLQRGENLAGAPVDLSRIAKSSYLGKDPFGDKPLDDTLEAEQKALLRTLQDRCYAYARVHITRILSTEMLAKVHAAPDDATDFKIGNFIAYSDTDDPNDSNSTKFHVGQCKNLSDGYAEIHCYATHGNAISRCEWAPLYQNQKGTYATGDPKHGEPVMDKIPMGEGSETYVHHYNVKLTKDLKLTSKTRQQLAKMGVTRHRLGHSFP